ncbi:MAG: hypothetical protein N2035_04445 [Chthoniobacterales bacterium]|nr:hypothetical protein [Chthoniobacterales bacterium]
MNNPNSTFSEGLVVPEKNFSSVENSPLSFEFDMYFVVMEEGKPVELGRGAMGVTYKAVHKSLGTRA